MIFTAQSIERQEASRRFSWGNEPQRQIRQIKGTQPIVFGTPLAGWVDFKGFWLD